MVPDDYLVGDHHHPLLLHDSGALLFVMAADKFYLHITAAPQEFCLERHPFGNLTFVDLPPLIGDRSGHGHVTLTYRFFRNQPLFVIAADDNFANKNWPVTAVINDRWFRGAFVILAERSRDPAARPSQGDTFFDGLTADECDEAIFGR